MIVKHPRMIIKQHEYFINYRYIGDISVTSSFPSPSISSCSNHAWSSPLLEEGEDMMLALIVMAIHLPSRKYGGACRAVQGSAAVYPIMEDIGLPRGCARSLGHGDNTVYQA